MTGLELSGDEESLLKSTLRNSNHPLSRSLYSLLNDHNIVTLDDYEEHIGEGITAKHNQDSIKIGSAPFVGYASDTRALKYCGSC